MKQGLRHIFHLPLPHAFSALRFVFKEPKQGICSTYEKAKQCGKRMRKLDVATRRLKCKEQKTFFFSSTMLLDFLISLLSPYPLIFSKQKIFDRKYDS